jgi:hypothetical protein
MSKFKMMKVFDCQDMPAKIQKAFFASEEASNDSYVSICLEDFDPEDKPTANHVKVFNWLLENGAEKGETVIVAHWW